MGKRELDAAFVLVGLAKRRKEGAVVQPWLPKGTFDVFDSTCMIVRCIASHPPETQDRVWQRAENSETPCPRCLKCSWQVLWVRDGSLRCMACCYRRF